MADRAGTGVTDNTVTALGVIRSHYTELPGALQRVAEQVLLDPLAAARTTIVELAERSGTSASTVTRFCRAIGFDGYADLRLAIAGETGWAARSAGWTQDIGRQIEPSDPLDRVLGQIMAADTLAMRDTMARLDLTEATRAADVISKAVRVDVYCTSGSALAGVQVQCSLTRLGIAAWSWPDLHNGLASAARLSSGDAALGVSHSGHTRSTVEMLAMAASRGATTIALTGFAKSPLAELADIVLLTAAQPADNRPHALSARHPQLVVLDLLIAGVAQRVHTPTPLSPRANTRDGVA